MLLNRKLICHLVLTIIIFYSEIEARKHKHKNKHHHKKEDLDSDSGSPEHEKKGELKAPQGRGFFPQAPQNFQQNPYQSRQSQSKLPPQSAHDLSHGQSSGNYRPQQYHNPKYDYVKSSGYGQSRPWNAGAPQTQKYSPEPPKNFQTNPQRYQKYPIRPNYQSSGSNSNSFINKNLTPEQIRRPYPNQRYRQPTDIPIQNQAYETATDTPPRWAENPKWQVKPPWNLTPKPLAEAEMTNEPQTDSDSGNEESNLDGQNRGKGIKKPLKQVTANSDENEGSAEINEYDLSGENTDNESGSVEMNFNVKHGGKEVLSMCYRGTRKVKCDSSFNQGRQLPQSPGGSLSMEVPDSEQDQPQSGRFWNSKRPIMGGNKKGQDVVATSFIGSSGQLEDADTFMNGDSYRSMSAQLDNNPMLRGMGMGSGWFKGMVNQATKGNKGNNRVTSGVSNQGAAAISKDFWKSNSGPGSMNSDFFKNNKADKNRKKYTMNMPNTDAMINDAFKTNLSKPSMNMGSDFMSGSDFFKKNKADKKNKPFNMNMPSMNSDGFKKNKQFNVNTDSIINDAFNTKNVSKPIISMGSGFMSGSDFLKQKKAEKAEKKKQKWGASVPSMNMGNFFG